MGKQILQTGTVLKIPAEVAVCPICGAALYTDFDCWYFDEKEGQWLVDSCNIDCETEPDIDSFEWEEWFACHYSQPYTDWLPLEKKIVEWINENYCFVMEDENRNNQYRAEDL